MKKGDKVIYSPREDCSTHWERKAGLNKHNIYTIKGITGEYLVIEEDSSGVFYSLSKYHFKPIESGQLTFNIF